MKKAPYLFLIFLIVFWGTSCGRVKLDGLVYVDGIVTYKDKPLEGATVGFLPKNFKSGDRIGTGMTDKRGKFELRTIGELGVLPNEYSVIVIKNVEETNDNRQSQINDQLSNLQRDVGRARPKLSKKIKSLIPSRYNSDKSSGLSFVVSEQGLNDIQINLTD
ncbi:MAG: hypothetical protein LBB88_08915 [Planctomycetaceae bacterium]|nr:hypothetical protein [Planctomycetaceae bacterium]